MATSTLRARIEGVLREQGIIHKAVTGEEAVTHCNPIPEGGFCGGEDQRNPSVLTNALIVECAEWLRETMEKVMEEVKGDGA